MGKYKPVGKTEDGVTIYEKVGENGDSEKRAISRIQFLTAIVVLITAIVALIGSIRTGKEDKPLACSFSSSIIRGIYACGPVNINQVATPISTLQPTSTPVILAATATPISNPLTATPYPTYTAYPTYTPLPTQTNLPIETFSSPPPILTATLTPTPTDISLEISNTATPSRNELTHDQIDAIFGAGNWFCFPHTMYDIGARDFPRPFIVSFPIRHVEYWYEYYYEGEEVPGHGGATVSLQKKLPRTECPSSQIRALTEWDELHASHTSIDRSQIDNLLGQGNWQCSGNGPFTSVMLVRSVSNLVIQYPSIGVDSNYIKYGVGDVISSIQSGTVWLWEALPKDQCP